MKNATTTAYVVKPFPYAHDGKTIVHLAEGDEVEIHTDLIEGLKGEGFVTLDKPKGAKSQKPAAEPAAE